MLLSLWMDAKMRNHAPCIAADAKPPRTNSTVNEDNNEVALEEPPSKRKPHETLWHKDGTVVLATDVFLYRVHKGVLANHSTVFRDMFEQPNTGEVEVNDGAANSFVDSWDGVPLVRMVDDEDDDVYNFLNTLYDRK